MIFILVGGGDEAGRGSVIGPLVVGFVVLTPSQARILKKLGVKDSKQLSREKRNFLYKKIKSIAEEVKSYKISAKEINEAMSNSISLNDLEAIYFARLISNLKSEPNIIYLDSPEFIEEKFSSKVLSYLDKDLKIVSRHKADENFVAVSSASIIAKVERDRFISYLKKKFNIDIGSGYPSDNITIGALRNELNRHMLKDYIRSHWYTINRIRQYTLNRYSSE